MELACMIETTNAPHTPLSCPAQAGHPVNASNAVNTGSPASAGDDSKENGAAFSARAARTRSLRATADLLCLWGLCNKTACRRAGMCRRDARDCLARYAAFAPEDARCGALALLQGARDGVSADDVRAHVPDDIAALAAWTAQVRAAARGPGGAQAAEPGTGA
jgi:hypothetical protein